MTTYWLHLSFAAALLGFTSTTGLSQKPFGGRAGCVQMRWGEPATISTPSAFGGYVETPQILQSKEGIYFTGSPGETWENDPTKIRHVVGFLRRSDGTFSAIPTPDGVGRIAAPRATIAADGALYLLWVPSDSTGFADRSENSRLLSSRFIGDAWTLPDTIFREAKALHWAYSSLGEIASSGDDRELAVSFLMTKTFALLQLVGSSWRTRLVDGVTGQLARPRLAALPSGIRILASIDQVRSSTGLPALLARRSLDAGTTWGPPVWISQPDSHEFPQDPFLFAIPDGRLIVVWTGSNPNGKRTQISVAVSLDTGRTWTPPSRTTVQGELESMRAAVSRDGTLFVAVREHYERTRRPKVFAWNGTWSPVWNLPTTEAESFGQPTIGIVDKRVIVSWATRISPAQTHGQVLPVTRLVIGQPDC